MPMQPNLFENPEVQKQRKNTQESYEQFIEELREDIKEDYESDYLSEAFQEELSSIIFLPILNEYGPLKFYWLNLIEKLVETMAIFEEDIQEDNDLIGYFSDSDLLGPVVDLLEAGMTAEEVLHSLIGIQELQIVSFFNLHINESSWQPEGPVSYIPVPELGDKNGVIFLRDQGLIYETDFADGDVLPIVGFFPETGELQIMVEDKVQSLSPKDYNHKYIEKIRVNPGVLEDGSLDTSFFSKIDQAIDRLKKTTPEMLHVFNTYTKVLVPLYQKELVSFSMQVLPGYSSINFRDRDDVDLMDDLLHENGHHFLNNLLEGEEELIYEDDEKIFYSPWRQALRPVRGVYHAQLTFYWAYLLFKKLSLSESTKSVFTSDETQKIYFRFLEEYLYLKRCHSELEDAFNKDKISEEGMFFVNEILKEIKECEGTFSEIKLRLSNTEEINRLEKEII